MKKILMILAFLSISTAYADTVVKYGVNVPRENERLGSSKAIFLSNQAPIWGPIIRQYEVGGWVDNTGKPGQKSALMVSPSAGVNVNAGVVYAQALVGPSLISNTDTVLGGHFQFNNDFAFGLRDPDTKATIGFNYKHLSSAGLELPNRGRDFLMFRVSIPWP